MKTKLNVVIGLLLIAFMSCGFGFSQFHVVGKGEVVSEKRTISKFVTISSSVSADIKFTQGEGTSLELRGQKNILDLLETRVEGNELIIEFKDNTSISTSKPIEIIIANPMLEALSIAGSGSFVAESKVTSPKMDLNVSGSGDIAFGNLEAANIETNISGSGSMSLGGTSPCQKLNVSISGSGKFASKQLRAENVEINISGSGNCKVYATGRIDAHVSGSGDVYYDGAAVIDAEVSGSGHVTKTEF
jgi:hypothetical protein